MEQQRNSSTPVCHLPASGCCSSCSSSSSSPLPQFFARLSSVDHASAFHFLPSLLVCCSCLCSGVRSFFVISATIESLWSCCLNLKPTHPDEVHCLAGFCGNPTASSSALPPAAVSGVREHYGLSSVEACVQGSGILSHRDIRVWGQSAAVITLS